MQKSKTIHCWNCGKEMTCGRGVYEYENKYLGHLSVPYSEGELHTCDCGEAPYVSAALSARMAEYEQKRIEQLLLLCVGGDMHEFKSNLIGMSDLERELGVTRQAIGKTPKYRNHIYHVGINGDILWWKPSVRQFKAKGDGRFAFGPMKAAPLRRFKALVEMIKGFVPLRSAAMFAF